MTSESCPYTMDTSGRDIQGEAALLRQRGPASQVELPGGVLAWAITDTALIKRLLTDPRVSRDPYLHWPAWENGEGELAKNWSMAMWIADRNMITAYGDEHRRLRKLVAKAFTARRTQAMRPRIEAITEALLDEIAVKGTAQPVDLRMDLAYALPTQVISELLGVPDRIKEELLAAIGAWMTSQDSAEDAARYAARGYELLLELIALKRSEPADDLVSALIAARDDEEGSALSEQELVDTVLLMFTAGHETTANLIDQAVFQLLTHREQRERVLNGDVSWADVIEETLRLEAPFANLPLRYAVEDIEISSSVTIPKGDAIIISFAASGRDPLVHGPSADQFDPSRETLHDHVIFGHGVHFCVGAPLARMEAETALPALFQRFPGLALAKPAAEVLPMESFISNGHRELLVVLG